MLLDYQVKRRKFNKDTESVLLTLYGIDLNSDHALQSLCIEPTVKGESEPEASPGRQERIARQRYSSS
jgi:hypothetical protein